jgi:hypothetical protein
MSFGQMDSRSIETAPKDREFYGIVSDHLKSPVGFIDTLSGRLPDLAVCRWQDGAWVCNPPMKPSHWWPKTT